jgi:chromosome transmission fidelity protein 1
VQDIEDMVKLGKTQSTCPYYGSRKGVKSAELVILPYNSLLHKSTRQTLDINLKGNIVIIDEAHNIIDAISTMYSQIVSYAQVFKRKDLDNLYRSVWPILSFLNTLKSTSPD